ncbi:MAG: ATP-binding protein [Patescibacteria group bacterium]
MLTPGFLGSRLATALWIVVLLAIGLLLSLYVYREVDQTGRAHIVDRAATLAAAISPEQLSALSGSEADLGTASYESLKQLLMEVRSVNSDVRFIYLIGREDTSDLFFFVDSEPADSEDYSPPGQIYAEATPAMHALFTDSRSRTEGPDRDRWGVWISGYAPVTGENGQVVALLGIDLPADDYLTNLIIYSALPFLASLVLVLLFLLMSRAHKETERRLEQKAEFLSIASHELRTPLTGVRWAVEGLLRDTRLPEDDRSLLTMVHSNLVGLIARINNFLDVSAIESRKHRALVKEPLSIRLLFTELAESLTLSAKQRSVTIVLDPSITKAGSFVADRQMMHHAFFNLLANAVKYTNEGTTVDISYEASPQEHRFHITDHGAGIKEEDRRKIFEGYKRLRAAIRSGEPGSGLGLYLTKRAVTLHGGTVEVSSAPGAGATFTVRLPQ